MGVGVRDIPQQWRDHDKKVRPYIWSHRWLSWPSSLLKLGLLLAVIFAGTLDHWAVSLEQAGYGLWMRWLLFFGSMAAVSEIVSLPFSAGHQQVERRYGLSKQTWKSWWLDKLKTWVLAGVLGTAVLGLIYLSVAFFRQHWWFACATLLILFSVVLAQLTPVLLIPIFFKLEPMESGTLKDRLLKLCERFQVKVADVYHLGLGEKTEKGNAAFVGLWRTKRIIIGDTLYKKFPAEQVEAVFAHELGHQVHNDLWKGILASSFILYLTFFLANEFCMIVTWPLLHLDPPSPLGLFAFFVTLSILQMPFGVLQHGFTRHCERQADAFAREKIGSGIELANALERLTLQNFSYYRPNRLIEWLTYSHPAPWRRIFISVTRGYRVVTKRNVTPIPKFQRREAGHSRSVGDDK